MSFNRARSEWLKTHTWCLYYMPSHSFDSRKPFSVLVWYFFSPSFKFLCPKSLCSIIIIILLLLLLMFLMIILFEAESTTKALGVCIFPTMSQMKTFYKNRFPCFEFMHYWARNKWVISSIGIFFFQSSNISSCYLIFETW